MDRGGEEGQGRDKEGQHWTERGHIEESIGQLMGKKRMRDTAAICEGGWRDKRGMKETETKRERK